MSMYEIIKRPIISEKSTALMEVANRYVFEVDLKANKTEIRDAIQKLFNVKVTGIRTMVGHGKTKRIRGMPVKLSAYKKAIVSLAAGQKIDLFPGQ